MGRIEGKVALVTGAAQGMGKAIALRFAREGANVAVDDILWPDVLKTAEEIRAMGRKAIAVEADVSKKSEVEWMVKSAIDAFGRIDILMNNAGIGRHAPFLDLSEEDWDKVIDVDLKGVFLCTQAVARHMVKQKSGVIINTSSVAGIGSGGPEIANYGSAKAGVANLTRIAARAFSPHGIRVNAVAPGMILTAFSRNRRSDEELAKFIEGRKGTSLLGRIGMPDDVANLVLFLASDEASFITGQIIAVDGGRIDKL